METFIGFNLPLTMFGLGVFLAVYKERLLHTVPKIVWIWAWNPTCHGWSMMKRYMSGFCARTRHKLLHPLQPVPCRFSDYFLDSVENIVIIFKMIFNKTMHVLILLKVEFFFHSIAISLSYMMSWQKTALTPRCHIKNLLYKLPKISVINICK